MYIEHKLTQTVIQYIHRNLYSHIYHYYTRTVEKANAVDCHVAESQEAVDRDYNTIVRNTTRSTIRMSDNNAYQSRDGISIESNVAYFAQNRVKSAYEDDDYMYEYI